MSKFEIAITTLFIGFCLGQATDFIKFRWSINRKIKAIKSEVKDIERDFSEKFNRIIEVIDTMKPNHVGIQVPGKISNMLYQKHYVDVAPFLSRGERQAIQLIYNHVDHFNEEVSNDGRSSFQQGKKSMFLLHNQCLFGKASARFYLTHKGKKLFTEQDEKIIEINSQIEKLAKSSGIAS